MLPIKTVIKILLSKSMFIDRNNNWGSLKGVSVNLLKY